MKNKLKSYIPKIRTISLYTISTFIAARLIASAGNLAPSEAPAPTMVTLDHLFNKIQDNYYYFGDEPKLSISTLLSPANSMRTLLEVYTAIPSISPDTIATGTTIMGIPGNVIIPTANTVQYGVQFGDMPYNYQTGTISTPTNIWSNASTTANWNNALVFCNNLSEGGHAWRLPKANEIVQGLSEPVNGFGQYVNVWSGTDYGVDPYDGYDKAFLGSVFANYTEAYSWTAYKNWTFHVRCTR
ncbi:MAG: hypothetical protein WC229_01315 [Candidatus Paceibacterota bacterium]|jgi:hypothetical protein